ncbi:MAG: hypothetical protein R3E12_12745 [Candidatus Eisenbacteria bacterium]
MRSRRGERRFLQEGLRGGSGGWTTTQADSLAAVLRSSHALRRMVKIATPGQRILGLLLAGFARPPAVRLLPNSRLWWWLPPAAKLIEPDSPVENGGCLPAWSEALERRSANGLLPALTAALTGGQGGGPSARALTRRALEGGLPPLALIVDRTLHEAYLATRSPHRWLHLWAEALLHCAWPSSLSREGLSDDPASCLTPSWIGTGNSLIPIQRLWVALSSRG